MGNIVSDLKNCVVYKKHEVGFLEPKITLNSQDK